MAQNVQSTGLSRKVLRGFGKIIYGKEVVPLVKTHKKHYREESIQQVKVAIVGYDEEWTPLAANLFRHGLDAACGDGKRISSVMWCADDIYNNPHIQEADVLVFLKPVPHAKNSQREFVSYQKNSFEVDPIQALYEDTIMAVNRAFMRKNGFAIPEIWR